MTAPRDGADDNAPEEISSGDDLTADGARVRFKGIVEADGRTAAPTNSSDQFSFVSHDERRWNAMSRQVWQVSRLTAIFVSSLSSSACLSATGSPILISPARLPAGTRLSLMRSTRFFSPLSFPPSSISSATCSPGR